MMKRNNKKALVLSLLSLLLCCSMLVGTTFAWFTDSVQSGNNKIVAGNLDVELTHTSASVTTAESVEGNTNLFVDENGKQILWEPGVVAWENLTVSNEGTLALKYEMNVNFANENKLNGNGLSEVLQVAMIPGGVNATNREDVKAAAEQAVISGLLIDTEVFASGMLLPVGRTIPNAPADAVEGTETYGIVIWWEPGSDDNKWNVQNGGKVSDFDATNKNELHIDLGITLVATQLEAEDDSFDNTYDEPAKYPAVVGGTLEEGATEALKLNIDPVTVNVPAGSPAGSYKLVVERLSVSVDENDVVSLDTEMSVLKDGVPTEGIPYHVEIQTDIMSTIHEVTHKGETVAVYSYDPFTGIVSFETDSFSPFAVDYTVFGKEVVLNDAKDKILSGFFTEVNPADVDTSLQDADSAYMVVDYVKDGKTVYSVSEKATTVIVDPATQNGKLWSIISGLQNNVHSTVYLKPGTYNEGTTIYVYSSMDIIGMGDAEDIKVVKTSSSGSNRHLFNCSGSKADYIEVTIRNMTLDATAKTTNSKDNAAVQSIRKSKVKCYDLNIIKGTGWDAVAFYVNGNNAVNGVKYPAYLYAENCSLNTTRAFGVVSTASPYKFFHNGVTYGGTAYTNNSGSIKNTVMDWDDWDWED